MAFLDNISKKINGATGVSKLNSSISEEEAKINSAYTQIGKLYCANHEDDYEECYAVCIGIIKDAEKKIAELKASILEIKGMAVCTKCGAYIPSGSAFCNSCGTPVPKAVVDNNTVICPSCGNSVAKGMRFCTSCGFRMPEAQQPAPVSEESGAQIITAAVQVPEDVSENVIDIDIEEAANFVMNQQNGVEYSTEAVIEEPVVPVTGKICPVCGKALEADMLFCTECGTRL